MHTYVYVCVYIYIYMYVFVYVSTTIKTTQYSDYKTLNPLPNYSSITMSVNAETPADGGSDEICRMCSTICEIRPS